MIKVYIPLSTLAKVFSSMVITISCGQAMATKSCLELAAEYHYVNPVVLTAVVKVESRMNPTTITNNSNNTRDFGLGGINDIHLPELRKWGIDEEKLMNPCVNLYVAAWYLSKRIKQYGNTWFGVATYHSKTPYYNNRYQILLQNALIDMGYANGPKKQVPPLRRNVDPSDTSTSTAPKN